MLIENRKSVLKPKTGSTSLATGFRKYFSFIYVEEIT